MVSRLLRGLAPALGIDIAKSALLPTNPHIQALEALALQQSAHQRRAQLMYAGVPMVTNIVTGVLQGRAQRHMAKKLAAAQVVQASMLVNASAVAKAAAVAKGATVLKVALVVGGLSTACLAGLAVGWWLWGRARPAKSSACEPEGRDFFDE